MFSEILTQVKKSAPLVHCITNFVAANDCANILLACGASPIMAVDAAEAEEITALSAGLCINLGTPDFSRVSAMLISGKKANELGLPAVLDPVGAGASKMRTDTAKRLIDEVKFAVIRGNISEIAALASGSPSTRGVDADFSHGDVDFAVQLAKSFAQKTGAVVAITGETDIAADARRAFCIYNGSPMMRYVTGAGCQLSAMLTAYAAANPDAVSESAAAAVCAMGLCGEKAYSRLTELDGSASYRNYITDAVYNLTPEELERGAKYEIR